MGGPHDACRPHYHCLQGDAKMTGGPSQKQTAIKLSPNGRRALNDIVVL
jgi:hypothetical protein